MAIVNYPALDYSAKTRMVPRRNKDFSITALGTVRGRQTSGKIVYDATVIHEYISAADADLLRAHYAEHKSDTLLITWAGRQYELHYVKPPEIQHVAYQLYQATTVMVGNCLAFDAPWRKSAQDLWAAMENTWLMGELGSSDTGIDPAPGAVACWPLPYSGQSTVTPHAAFNFDPMGDGDTAGRSTGVHVPYDIVLRHPFIEQSDVDDLLKHYARYQNATLRLSHAGRVYDAYYVGEPDITLTNGIYREATVRLIGNRVAGNLLDAMDAAMDTLLNVYVDGLFDNGEQGTMWGPLPYYLNTEGTQEATWGSPVALIHDASGNDAPWWQASNNQRPVLGRVPVGGRTNLHTYSEDFVNAAWTKINGALRLAPEEISPIGLAHKFEETDGAGTSKMLQQVIFFDTGTTVISYRVVKAAERIRMRGQIFTTPAAANADFDIENGEVISSPRGTAGVVDLGDGWFLCWIRGVTGASSSHTIRWYPMVGDATSYPGEEGYGYYVAAAGCIASEVMLPYQKVVSQYDVTEEGVQSIEYLYFDLTDDRLACTLPAITGGTIVLVGTNGVWIDDGFNFEGGTFYLGPTTYSGGPAGILSVIGNLLVGGCIIIDRPITEAERQQIADYFVLKGSPGLITLGPELIVNGDGSEGLEGWTFQPLNGGESTVTPILGGFRVDDPEGSNSNFRQNGVFPDAGIYLMGWTVLDRSGGAYRLRGPVNDPPLNTSGSRVAEYSSGGPLSVQNVSSAGDAFLEFTNISVRQLVMP